MRTAMLALTLALGLAVATRAARADAPQEIPLYSVWIGNYVCAQGETALRLTIESGPKGDATAKFEFGPTSKNRGVPHGRYWLTGTARVHAHGELAIKLVPSQWIAQPAGYTMVGLTAITDADQTALDGTIDFPGCSSVHVTRVAAEQAR